MEAGDRRPGMSPSQVFLIGVPPGITFQQWCHMGGWLWLVYWLELLLLRKKSAFLSGSQQHLKPEEADVRFGGGHCDGG